MSRRQLLGLVFLALATRVVYNALVLRDFSPLSDAHHYHDLARSIAQGDGFEVRFPFPDELPQATAFRPPLYPLVLAGAYAVLGAHVGVAKGLNVALGVGVVVLAALVTNRVAGPRAALFAGGLTALYPPLLANDGPSLAEPLSLCLMLLAVLLLMNERTMAAGAVTGLQVLTKPSAQGLVLVLAMWVLWRCGARRTLSFLVPVVLVVTPWILRNWAVMGSPVLVTSNGFNLAALYSPQAHDADAWLDASIDPRFEDVREESVAEEDEVAWDRALQRLAAEGLHEHPSDLFAVPAENAMRLLELAPLGNESAERNDGRHMGLRYSTLWATWLVLPLGVGGLVVARRNRAAQLLALSALYFTVVSVAFSPMAPRLRAPLDLACCLGAGVAVERLAKGRDGRVGVVIDLRQPEDAPLPSQQERVTA